MAEASLRARALARVSLLATAVLLSTACADFALNAATGKPMPDIRVSVSNAEVAYLTKHDTIYVCVQMRMDRGAWPVLDPSKLERHSIELPERRGSDPLVVPYLAWQGPAVWECPCYDAKETDFRRVDITLVTPDGVADSDARLDQQRLVIRDGSEVIAVYELQSVKAETGNALYWPLVPVAYVGDTVFLIAGTAIAVPALAAILIVASPFVLLDAARKGEWPQRSEPKTCEPAPPPPLDEPPVSP